MPVNWDALSWSERAEVVLRNVEGLTPTDKQQIYEDWSEYAYPETIVGHTQAEADLQQLAVEHLLKKAGKWEQEQKRRSDLMQKVN